MTFSLAIPGVVIYHPVAIIWALLIVLTTVSLPILEYIPALGELSGKKPNSKRFYKAKASSPSVAHSHIHPFNHSLSRHCAKCGGGLSELTGAELWSYTIKIEIVSWSAASGGQNNHRLSQRQLSLKSTAQKSWFLAMWPKENFLQFLDSVSSFV